MNLRKLPQQEKRVETGPTQFGNDWPGLFIRGDNALAYSVYLKVITKAIDSQMNPDLFQFTAINHNLKELLKELESVDERKK